ncbi:MAG: SDR family NAD(P)-dependent oxidoreductase [Ilumatobacteraceae bacterium]
MDSALGEYETIVLFGGTSDIGLAVVREFLAPPTRVVVLACRDTEHGASAAASLRHDGLRVDVVPFEATDATAAQRILAEASSAHGDLDVVIVAHALLGDASATCTDPVAAARLVEVNLGSAVAAVVAAGECLRRQGHGDIVVLSSVAGERVRSSNPVYGGTKAGLDGFAQGYGDRVAGDGVHVMVVRPGFVHSSMTKGMKAAPLATSPEAVASVVARGLRRRRRMVWAPPLLRAVFVVLRHLPATVWRRLPLG